MHERLSALVVVVLLVAASVAAAAALPSEQKRPKVRVHFWTAQLAPNRIVETSQKERDDSVKDLATPRYSRTSPAWCTRAQNGRGARGAAVGGGRG